MAKLSIGERIISVSPKYVAQVARTQYGFSLSTEDIEKLMGRLDSLEESSPDGYFSKEDMMAEIWAFIVETRPGDASKSLREREAQMMAEALEKKGLKAQRLVGYVYVSFYKKVAQEVESVGREKSKGYMARFAEKAGNINKSGLAEQVKFLMTCGWSKENFFSIAEKYK